MVKSKRQLAREHREATRLGMSHLAWCVSEAIRVGMGDAIREDEARAKKRFKCPRCNWLSACRVHS